MEIASVSPVTISKFVIDKKFFSLIIWQEDSFHITLFEEEGSWTGLFLPSSVSKFAISLNQTVEEYFKSVKVAMMNHSSEYYYEFKSNGSSASFMWARKEGQVKIRCGSVQLSKDDPPSTKDALIEALLFKNGNLERELDDLRKSHCNLKTELTTATNELDKIVNHYSDFEETLYGKFVQLINAKKDRIKLLEEHLSKYES